MLLLGILILELILISGMVTKRRGLFTTLTVKDWYHVACVYDGSEAIIYANGKIDNKKKFEGEPKHNGANFWMGARKSDGLPYFGLVDELRLYKRGLSQAEVKKNMGAEGLAVQPAQKLALTWGKMKVAK